MSKNLPQRRQDVLDRSADTEHVVLDRTNGQLHRLNATAAFIWSRCDGCHSVDQIAEAMRDVFESVPDDLEEEINAVIDELRAKGLLDSGVEQA